MGKYNSSIYRVRPLMKIIEKDKEAFAKLLSLVGIAPLGEPIRYRYDGEQIKEAQLKPTKKHLSALIDHMKIKDHGAIVSKGEKRQKLFFGIAEEREQARIEAQIELEEKYDALTPSSRDWFLFEGFTNPDIFIEGKDYILVCEGKWTEPHITTKTTHLSDEDEYRSQMVRHIQGALNHSEKTVYAFYIVDGDCEYQNELTKDAFVQNLKKETIQPTDEEKARIACSFYGYTTWQEIKKILPEVEFKSKKEIQ